KDSETKWRSLVQNAPDIIMIIDRSGRISYVNRNLDGILKESAIGKKLDDLAQVEFRTEYQKNLQEVMNSGAIRSFEVELNTPSKQSLWYETKMAPVNE
ncbi:MAG: PAS domain-containing protein, partial [Nitrosopumilaceae archaeon]|nr:PAS domain-containing protein [Nitrosopumilaceae archaeon]NIX62726.1 PAS domain-containing protein [Nitrosopumilaceae archaeon]